MAPLTIPQRPQGGLRAPFLDYPPGCGGAFESAGGAIYNIKFYCGARRFAVARFLGLRNATTKEPEQNPKYQIATQRSGCNLERTSSGMDEPCRLRRGEGYGACEDESASFADFFLARQKRMGRRRHGCGGATTGEQAVTGASLPTSAKSAGGTGAVTQPPEQNRRPAPQVRPAKTGGGRPPADSGILPHKGTGKALMLSEKIFNFPLAIFQKYNTIDKKERSQRAERCESANLTFHAYPTVA